MTELERFLAVVRFEKPDYWPIVCVSGLGYVHKGGLRKLMGSMKGMMPPGGFGRGPF